MMPLSGGQPPAAANDPAAVKMEFPCRSCGAMMTPRPPSRVVVCEYCGTENMVPDAIWKVLFPPAAAAPYLPASQVPIPAPAPRKANVTLIAVILVFVGLTFVLPVVLGLCGACLGLLGSIGASNVTQPAPPTTVVSSKQGPVSIKSNQGGGPPFDNLSVNASPSTVHVTPAVVTPSFEKADVYATARAIFDAVRRNWHADARLGLTVMTDVGSDGTATLSAGGGSMVMDFYLPGGAGDLPPGETTVKGGLLKVVVSNGTVMEVPVDVQTTTMGSTPMIDAMPVCTVAGLWKEASAAGYPADAGATILFPYEPSSLTSKERKHVEDTYAYMFTMPAGKPGKKPVFFLLKSCKPK
jgi:hypothetical protein